MFTLLQFLKCNACNILKDPSNQMRIRCKLRFVYNFNPDNSDSKSTTYDYLGNNNQYIIIINQIV